MKPIIFCGDSLKKLRDFSVEARQQAGFQLDKVQRGEDPDDWKPMKIIGNGVRELRIRDQSGAFRVIYVARMEEGIFVLHSFQNKSQKTKQSDLDIAKVRYNELKRR